MMPEWHQFDSSSTMSEQQESAKKKTLKSSSRSFWFSTGLKVKYDLLLLQRVIISFILIYPVSKWMTFASTVIEKSSFQGFPSIWNIEKHILSLLRGNKTWVQSQTQNKAQWFAACGHVSASSHSLCFILSLWLYASCITSRPCRKLDQGQPRTTSQKYIVEPTSTMPHTKIQGHLSFGSKGFFKKFWPNMRMIASY